MPLSAEPTDTYLTKGGEREIVCVCVCVVKKKEAKGKRSTSTADWQPRTREHSPGTATSTTGSTRKIQPGGICGQKAGKRREREVIRAFSLGWRTYVSRCGIGEGGLVGKDTGN